MSRNLARTNCRTCEGEVKLSGIPYKGTSHYQDGLWIADAICTMCETKYSAWIGPTSDGYGNRQTDRLLIADHGFYDLSYRSTFNDEAGPDDLPKDKVKVYRVVRVGDKEIWKELD